MISTVGMRLRSASSIASWSVRSIARPSARIGCRSIFRRAIEPSPGNATGPSYGVERAVAKRGPAGLLPCLALAACTAGQPPEPAHERGPPRLREHAWIAPDGAELPLTRWLPDGEPEGVVLALHGFAEHRGVFYALAPHLAAAGYVVYAYDQRGFGDTAARGAWPGGERLAADARAAWRLLRDRYTAAPVHLLGHSMGGAVAALATTGEGAIRPASTILVSPAVHGWQSLPWIQRIALRVSHFLAPGARPRQSWGRAFVDVQITDDPAIRYLHAHDERLLRKVRIDMVHGVVELMDTALERVPRIRAPVLIQYGERDDIIPANAACRLLRRMASADAPGVRLALYPQGYHYLTRDRQRGRTIGDIVGWLAQPGAPPASGADTEPRTAARRLCDDAPGQRPAPAAPTSRD